MNNLGMFYRELSDKMW